jgi:hypothetical protein
MADRRDNGATKARLTVRRAHLGRAQQSDRARPHVWLAAQRTTIKYDKQSRTEQ